MTDKQEDPIVISNMQAFQHPLDPQNGSRLLRLPAELRIKILRNLLKKLSPIQSLAEWSSSEDYSNRNYRAYTQLSSQILSTCQMVYNEARHVLYEENTIQLYIKERITSCWFELLTRTIEYPLDPCQIPMHQDALLDYAHIDEICDDCVAANNSGSKLPDGCENAACQVYDNQYGGELICIYPALRQFTHIRLVLSWTCDKNGIFVAACRALRDLLIGKHVSISMSQIPPPHRYIRVLSKELDISQARVLRCASISFEDISGPKVERQTALVFSGAPMYDTHATWRSLMDGVIDKVPDAGDKSFAKHHEGILDRLKARSMKYGFGEDEFKKSRKKILRLVKRWWDKYFEHEDSKAIKANSLVGGKDLHFTSAW